MAKIEEAREAYEALDLGEADALDELVKLNAVGEALEVLIGKAEDDLKKEVEEILGAKDEGFTGEIDGPGTTAAIVEEALGEGYTVVEGDWTDETQDITITKGHVSVTITVSYEDSEGIRTVTLAE